MSQSLDISSSFPTCPSDNTDMNENNVITTATSSKDQDYVTCHMCKIKLKGGQGKLNRHMRVNCPARQNSDLPIERRRRRSSSSESRCDESIKSTTSSSSLPNVLSPVLVPNDTLIRNVVQKIMYMYRSKLVLI